MIERSRGEMMKRHLAFQEGERVAKLLGCDCADLYKNLLKPRIKVGNEFVTQGRNKDQVAYSVGAMSKAMFDRLFKWLVKKCNETLDTKQKRQHFIGVLDIAGFEIFDVSFPRAALHENIPTQTHHCAIVDDFVWNLFHARAFEVISLSLMDSCA